MSNGKIGFRIVEEFPRPGDELVASFRGLAAADVADAMGRFHYMDGGIVSRSGLPLCGVAVTVEARPGDNLMVHKALQVARPGDVIVVSTNGNTTSAVFGQMMCQTAAAVKLGGLVVDGAVRDVEGITALAFPVFSRTVCIGSCDRDGPGEINVPISCGGTVVMPGDIIVGDTDGIAVVPQHDAEEVLQNIHALMDREQKRIADIRGGTVFNAEIDEALRRKGIIQ